MPQSKARRVVGWILGLGVCVVLAWQAKVTCDLSKPATVAPCKVVLSDDFKALLAYAHKHGDRLPTEGEWKAAILADHPAAVFACTARGSTITLNPAAAGRTLAKIPVGLPILQEVGHEYPLSVTRDGHPRF